MILLGAVGVITGALLPAIVYDLGLSPSQVGLLVSIPAVGYVAVVLLAGTLTDRLGFRAIWLLGVVVAVCSSIGAALATSYGWLLAAVGVAGLAAGFFDGSIVPLVAIIAAGNSGKQMNRLNVFFGAGATITPFLVGLGLRREVPWRWHFAALSLFALLVGAVVLRANIPSRKIKKQGNPRTSSR